MRFHVNLKFNDIVKIILFIGLIFCLYTSCENANALSSSPDSSYKSIVDLTSSYNDLSSQYGNNYFFDFEDLHNYAEQYLIDNNFSYYSIFYTTGCHNTSNGLCTPSGTMYHDFFLVFYDSLPDMNAYSYYYGNGQADFKNYYRINYNSSYNIDIILASHNQDSSGWHFTINSNNIYHTTTNNVTSLFSYLRNDHLTNSSIYNGDISTTSSNLYTGNYTLTGKQGSSNSVPKNLQFWYLLDKNFSIPIKNFTGNSVQNYQFKFNNNYYEQNDNFLSVYEYRYLSSLPEITLSNLTPFKDNLNNIYKYTINVNFSLFDLTNFTYQWKQPDSDNFEDLLSNNLTLELSKNGSYAFRIINKNTSELVTSSNVTIINISIPEPFIDYHIYQIGSCIVKYNNSDLEICQNLSLEPSVYDSDYFFQYSLDNGTTWENLYSLYSFNVIKDDIIPLRVLDSDNNILWNKTLNFSGLDSIPNDIGIVITYNDTSNGLVDDEQFYTDIYFYNLDFDLRNNVYISYDGGFNFDYFDITNYGLYYLGRTKFYSNNLVISIKILDNDNNIIFTSSHSVDLNSSTNKDFLKYLENFNRQMNGPVSSFVNAPLRLINMINTPGACTPLSLPFNHIGDLQLPCIQYTLQENVPSFLNIYQIITTCIIGYYCGLSCIQTMKTLSRPDDDRIEVVEL